MSKERSRDNVSLKHEFRRWDLFNIPRVFSPKDMSHYYVIIDFECTCWSRGGMDDPLTPAHEIIEFPAVFLNSETLEIDFEFHSFVRPTEDPVLTEFCTELTGINQSTVSESSDLKIVLADFRRFLQFNSITSFTVCADGPWDFEKFLYPECTRKGIPYPEWADKWIDVRKKFAEAFGFEKWVGVNDMLEYLELEFEGRPHSGIDDARNIARIMKALHNFLDKKRVRPNRKITAHRNQKKKK